MTNLKIFKTLSVLFCFIISFILVSIKLFIRVLLGSSLISVLPHPLFSYLLGILEGLSLPKEKIQTHVTDILRTIEGFQHFFLNLFGELKSSFFCALQDSNFSALWDHNLYLFFIKNWVDKSLVRFKWDYHITLGSSCQQFIRLPPLDIKMHL